MEIISKIQELRAIIKSWKKEGLTIGFVPTMGYLHEGHQSLIKKASEENDKVVVSIFVNPTQFGPTEDLSTYPRDLDRDTVLCTKAGANLIFTPEVSEMYPQTAYAYVDADGITTGLCGSKRPGHFRGVATVVTKLFNITTPDHAYFGEKDAQQLAVIKQMVRDLNMDVKIIGCPIIRENDGLAKSSRNTYLSAEERKTALILNKSLTAARNALMDNEKDSAAIKNIILQKLKEETSAKVDYVEIVDSLTLEPVRKMDKDCLIAIAVYIGKTRLIDNFTWEA